MNPRRRVQHKAEDTIAYLALVTAQTGAAVTGVFNVVSFGADPTGIRDSTTAIQKTITAATSGRNGGVVLFPAGTYKITSTINVANVIGMTLQGVGVGLTTLVWSGPSYTGDVIGSPMILFADCFMCACNDMRFTATTNVVAGIQTGTNTNSPTNSRNTFRKLYFDGVTDLFEVCVQIGGGIEAVQNDFHNFYDCTFTNYSLGAVYITDTQCYNECFVNCIAQGGELTTLGSINSSSAILTTPSHVFQTKDIGKTIEIAGAGSASATLRTTIVSVNTAGNPHECTLTDMASTTVTSHVVTYSSQFGIQGLAGSATWINGALASHLVSDVITPAVDDGAYMFLGSTHESSRCILQTASSTDITKLVIFQGCRFSGDAAIATVPFIQVLCAGITRFSQCQIGDPGNSLPITIQFQPPGTTYEFWSFILDDCQIATSNTAANLFVGIPWYPTDTTNSKIVNAGGATLLGSQVLQRSQPGSNSTIHINWGNNHTWYQTIGKNITFVFDATYVGIDTTQRLFVNYSGGNWTTTWPVAVDWGTAGAPSMGASGTTDIFEFRSDGTIIYGVTVGRGF